ncbi:MAG: 2-amino-4-hydroxy-6-hydroxymethyldihydropteridine diphosphokinase [Thermodesulfobacteriota bacterium]|nr:2-amino-4-hydroxy-6-hydroxymethyldihydropteridine diphosphokinase [Thermodesulfobacteriota bacterium]
MKLEKRAYIGLGANLGNRIKNCIKALGLLSAYPEIEVSRCSQWYETEPVDINTSQWFINAVAEIITALGPEDLLSNLLAIEKAMGRDRLGTEDRPIDLDLLFMEGVRIQTSNHQITKSFNHQITKSPNHQIQVPHPRLSTRQFVLAPWAELAPNLLLAPWSKTVSELLAELPENSPEVRKLNHKETQEGY